MRKTKVKIKELQKAVYAPPAIEITDVIIEQNVLDSGSGNIGDLPGEVW